MKKPPAPPTNRKWLKIAAVVAGIAIVILAVMIISSSDRPRTGSIYVASTPPGASVYLDGSSSYYEGTTPINIRGVSAGSHNVRLSMSGYKDHTSRRYVKAGKTSSINVKLVLTPVDIEVPQDKPVINSFEASPSKISAGESSTLRWSVSDATSRTIDPGMRGTVASTGTRAVSPTKTTTYTLTATNEAGKRDATVEVIVGPGVTEIDRRVTEIDRILGTLTYRGTPVEGIPIVLIASSECDVTKVDQQTYTDAQGRYFFLGISPGSYRIAINGWGGTDDTVEPYGHTCTWELEKKASSALTLDWTLHKNDLQITFPIEDTSIYSTSPTFRWVAYPDATRYEIVLIQVSPSRETIEWGTPTESTRFRSESPLTLGARYNLIVWAWDSTGQIANGNVYFSVKLG